MISALARWNGDHAMTKDTTKEAAGAAEVLLFDDWFDAIENGVRARVRGFIETMLEAELSDALSRPRYGRRKSGEEEAAPSVVGVRHGHRERTLAGTFGKTRIACAARTSGRRGRQDARMAERFASRLSAVHPGRRHSAYSFRQRDDRVPLAPAVRPDVPGLARTGAART